MLVSGVQQANKFSYTYIYIFFIVTVAYYKILNIVSVLYSRTLLFVFVMVACICQSSNLLFIPPYPQHSLVVTVCLSSLSVSLFLFVNKLTCIIF